MRVVKIFLVCICLQFVFVGAAKAQSTPDASMQKFVKALLDKDRNSFLTLFSKTKSFQLTNPMNEGAVSPHWKSQVTYEELSGDFKKKDGLYWLLMERADNGEMDCFADAVVTTDGKKWRKIGSNKFIPPMSDVKSPTFVVWRKEGKAWVVAEISYPSA